jgi:predicted small metal-binding protein
MKTFRCKDAGFEDCGWGAKADTEEEILSLVEEHGKQAHGLKSMDDRARSEARAQIVEIKAA